MAAAAEDEPDSLKIFWDHFFKSETGTYEKSTWLDLFLAEFLIRVNDGADPEELIKFCPVSGVVTLVGCELLCGLHRVTSAAGAGPSLQPALGPHNAGSPGSEWNPEQARAQPTSLFSRHNTQSAGEILRKYLLAGVAWRCLALLKALGVEGLSCCRQLSSVLVWLFGELCAAPAPASATAPVPASAPVVGSSPTPIHQLFSTRIWSKQKVKSVGSPGSKVNSANSSERGSVTGRSRHSGHTKTDSSEKAWRSPMKDLSSESCDSNDDLQVLNRSIAIKVSSPKDDFDYFNSQIRSSDEYGDSFYDSYRPPRAPKLKADDFMTEKHKEIISSEISSFEFILMITDLLQDLCRAESSLYGSEGSQISVQCINFTLRNLCTLQFSSVPGQSDQHDSCQVSRIKVALTELLIVSLDKVLVHSDLCAKLINNGILPMLLRLLEDVVCKTSAKYQTKNDTPKCAKDSPSKTESENLLKFVFGVAYSITAFFHCLLMQCRSVDKLREFTEQFKLYGECLKGGLLRDCIELMIRIPGVDQDETVVLIKKLIESIGKLISGMKRVRSEVLHSAACPRSRHKMCRHRVVAGMHHHHDVLGDAITGLPMSSACCVSVLYGTLTSLVADEEVAAQPVLRNKILKVMLTCGVCCCFSPGTLMESIVRLMLTQHSVAAACLHLLEHTVYGELGASVLIPKVTDQLPCSICEPCLEERKETPRMATKMCSHVAPVERKTTWSFLIHYNSLLQLDNHSNVLHATVGHLLRVTPKCRMEMKYELLFSVIYPTFIVAKHRYMIRLEESAYFLTISCLNIFASLLDTVPFAEHFIQKGGLSYVLELVSLPEFAQQCCSILEIAIIVEIFKLMKENSEFLYYREMSSLASVQMLFKSLSDTTEKFYKIFSLKFSEEEFSQLCDVTKERDILAVTPPIGELPQRKLSSPLDIKPSLVATNFVVEECIEDHLSVLKNVCTFWNSCAALCLQAPLFREHVVSVPSLLDSYALLKLTLRQLSGPACGDTEARLLIKLLEALLTVQFAVSDVTCGRSKTASCAVVRGAVSGGAGMMGGASGAGGTRGAGGLRALCGALVRVAARAPSATHVLPSRARAKVPPLVCSAGSVSAEASSGEEAPSGPYASEHSDATHTPPDEGYEADVEVCNFDVTTEKTRRHSVSLPSSDSSLAGIASALDDQGGAGAGLGAWAGVRGGEHLAHPELCVIVIDILTQIINKVMDAVESDTVTEETWVAAGAGAGVCRAVAARLATAPAPAPAPAPASAPAPAPVSLLRRLLAPRPARLLHAHRPQLQELQGSVLELVHVVASQRLDAEELEALLRLLLASAPPTSALLRALRRLLLAAPAHAPAHALAFPAPPSPHTHGEQAAAVPEGMGALSPPSQQAEALAQRLRDAHIRAGVASAWRVAAASAGVAVAGWAAWLQGFAVTARLRRLPPHTTDDGGDSNLNEPLEQGATRSRLKAGDARLLHVFSLGNDSLLMETWLDIGTGTIVFRISRPEAGAGAGGSEARVQGAVPARRWTHLALNVAERLHKRRIHVQITLFVNGYECETVSLPLQGILARKVTATNVLIGEASGAGVGAGAGAGAGTYELSDVRVYRAPRLTRHLALHLAAHSPSHACHVRCESPNYASVLTSNVLDSNIDWEQVYDMPFNVLREFHDSVLLSFSAHSPYVINLHSQNSLAMPSVFGGRGGGAGSGGGASAVPEGVRVRWAVPAVVHTHTGFYAALHALGGLPHLLYLFARVVELESSEEDQASALQLVLRACREDGRLYSALYACVPAPLAMLHQVLRAPPCRPGPRMLQVILQEACNAPVLSIGGGGILTVLKTTAALLEPELIAFIMRAWNYFDRIRDVEWEVEGEAGVRRGSAFELALECCGALLRAPHPRWRHNHRQVARVHTLHHLLHSFKERFLSGGGGSGGGGGGALSVAGGNALVALVRALVGAPPPPHHLAMLADFLLLMHQASDTFVTHSRANFYFLLTPETQEMSEFTKMTRKSSSRRKTKQKELVTEETADNDSDVVSDTGQRHARHSDDRNGTEPATTTTTTTTNTTNTTTTKQMKSIINSQIKENSKNAAAAADSESTEKASERETAPALAPAQALEDADLNEYIVVDLDDVRHTTVDIYTGGIYHQGRLRAGAEPGWIACEGLLLLLRDTIAMLPDHHLEQTLQGAVSGAALVVLANHRSGRVRGAVVRALSALQRRLPAPSPPSPPHLYLHLADQVSLYESTWEVVAACAALITKCDVPLEDQLDEDIWVEANEEWTHRCPPLLALLPASVADVALAHNITLLLRRLIDKSSLRALTEVALCEVVVRALQRVGRAGGALQDGRDLLLLDLQQLLIAVVLQALLAPHAMQTVCDIHNMLTFVEETSAKGEVAEGEVAVAVVARDAQVALFVAQLDHLERRLADAAPSSYAAYLTTVLSSAVSRSGGGGGGREARVERGEVAARHLNTAQRAVAFLLSRPPTAPLASAAHADLYARLVHTLLMAVQDGSRTRWWGGGAEWTELLQELIWWGAAPAPGARPLQPALVRALYHAPPAALTPLAPPATRKLAVYLLSMLQHLHLTAEEGGEAVELPILDWARSWAVSLQAALPERLGGAGLGGEADQLLRQDVARWARAAARAQPAQARSVFNKENLCARVAESAMSMTRQVVEAQNGARKAFMAQLRRAHQACPRTHARWLQLLHAHAHEQGVWHDPRSYPQSWQLDPTEGPGRVRVRLRRAHLRIPARFLKPEHRYKAELAQRPPPLHSVLGRGPSERDGLTARLQPDETVVYMARVTHVTVDSETHGELLLTDRAIHFVPEESKGEEEAGLAWGEEWGGVGVGGAQCWAVQEVRAVATRRWCLQERAVEIFLNTRAHLLAFSCQQERATFLHHLPHKIEQESLTEAMNQWRNGQISNWEYLMRLNGLAGRSYNDLMQYPVLPFVLADYTSRMLDLNDPRTFRDLTKPIAVQRKEREQHYINTYNDLALARREGCGALVARQPHHYPSLYSNSGGVLHYLVRLPPFTQLFLNYQDNNFDMPDRTFHSLATTWRLITNDSPTDVKELIPELFYLPELFHNNEGLDLGVRQCGLGVDAVEVPAWAMCARLLVLLQRHALEAPLVTDTLPHWIDLVFGYKQTGQHAVDALNVFPACTYYGFDPSAMEDEVDRTAAAAMVRTYGQAPRQLLRAPHPHPAPRLLAAPDPAAQVEACGGARGVRWGRYVGSPDVARGVVTARRAAAASELVALPPPHSRTVAALPANSALLALTDDSVYEFGQSGGKETAWGILSWGHWDDVVRLKLRRDAPPEPLLYVPPEDQITCVLSSASASTPLVVGFQSGRVEAWRVRGGGGGGGARVVRRAMHAHRAPVCALAACARATLLVTACRAGRIVLWELTRLTYIRTLPNRGNLPVTHLAISPTLSDVASVHRTAAPRRSDTPTATSSDHCDEQEEASSEEDYTASYERDAPEKYQSIIRVHTVNARFVGSVRVAERVTCACYSSAPEGASVNVIAAGLHCARLRLYSSWDLRALPAAPDPRRPPHHAHPAHPVHRLTYNADSQVLFGLYADGVAVAWESEPSKTAPRIIPAHALL